VAAQALVRVVRAVHPVAVTLARLDVGQIAVPHVRLHLRHGAPGLAALVVEETQLDLLGDLAEQCEVRPCPVIGGAQRVRLARPDLPVVYPRPRLAGDDAGSRSALLFPSTSGLVPQGPSTLTTRPV